MNNLKIKTLAYVVVAAFIATAMLAPTATAQTKPSLTFTGITAVYGQGDDQAIVPETGKADVSIDWEWSINAPGYDKVGATQTQTLLSFSAFGCEDTSVKVGGATTYPIDLVDSSGAPSAKDSGTARFTLTATQAAPGETLISCTFAAASQAAGPNNQVSASNTDTISVNVVVKFRGLLSLTIPTTIKQASPQKQIQYDLEVSNLGNSLTNVRFDLRDAEAAQAGGWNPVPPTPVKLGSTAQGSSDTVKSVSFVVSTPFKNGWNNAEKTFTLDVTPESTNDVELKGSAVTVNVLARVRGVYVPSLEPMVLVGAVLGAAMVARLMRRE